MPKAEIHPTYYPQAKVTCSSCGNTFTIGSTKPELTVEICSNCHPFFTGKEVILDTEGRVEKFQKKQKIAAERKAITKKAPEEGKEQKRPLTLKELLEQG
ncbi:MAG: 50S ribosomal protein L31 [candidate division CPR1 bacterium GW2011_GWC1_49_13]|uniref:Large ribosomal subunit protein bL31 n=1 Tax=candidate division CPR1 bacterium GW2011_GWC1_49_13 TaxID=1618342 RepID=A0A0G1VIB3_9BACT|nr:MAG: 50S ribosomal protein L31 [candidate division CPR1 bacterium GW2011_GWC1_49_13]